MLIHAVKELLIAVLLLSVLAVTRSVSNGNALEEKRTKYTDLLCAEKLSRSQYKVSAV